MGVNEESLGLVGHTKIISIDSNSMEYQFCFLCQSITLGNAVGKNQGFTSRMPLSKKKKNLGCDQNHSRGRCGRLQLLLCNESGLENGLVEGIMIWAASISFMSRSISSF